jgi:hypothetical protein
MFPRENPLMTAGKMYRIVVLCLVLGLLVSQAWGQNLPVFPKEEILLVGGDFRIRSITSNIAGANLLGGGESGGYPSQDTPTKAFFDYPVTLILGFPSQ